MRKLLSFILAFTMIFTSVAASAAMSAEKIPAFLDKAGIIAEGTYADDTKVITRGEFAQMVAKLINIDNYKGLSTTQIFKDVPVDHPLFDVTTLLNQMYFIVGDGNGYFEPDENITAEAACKILVNLMGDQYFAKYYGGYIPAAAAKGLLSGVQLDANSNITVKAAMRLIYNTMIADISNSNLYDGNATSNNPQPEMFMSKRLGIYKIDGTITDDGISSLAGDTQIKKGYVKIGQYVFENKTGMDDLLGYPVEGFYRYDEDLDKNVLIFAYINENKTNVLELDDSDIASYASLTYEYYIDEDQYETEEAYLSPNYRIIYNGHVYSAETKESSFNKTQSQMLQPENGKVKAIDTDGDNYYDLIIVTDYTIVVVGTVDAENHMIYGDAKYTDIAIDLFNAADDLEITNADGGRYTLDVINPGAILSVAKSADGKFARVKYSFKSVIGKLSTTDGDYYTVDETEYKATKVFKDFLTAKPNTIAIGDNVVFYVTFDDEIVYGMQESEASIKTGYLVNLHYKSAMDDKLTLRILTSGSSLDDLQVADRVVIDGKLCKDKQQLANDLVAFKDYLIRYRLNQDGKINYIDTPYIADQGVNPNYLTESDDTLHVMKGANNRGIYYYSGSQAFSGVCAVDANTRVYVIPTDQDIEKAYVTSSGGIKAGGRPMTAYSTRTDSFFAEHIVENNSMIYSTPVTNTRPRYAVVTKITDALNPEGEPVKKVTLTTGDRYSEHLTERYDTLVCTCAKGQCATDPIVVDVGDVVAYEYQDNVIRQGCIVVCYDHSEKKVVNAGSSYFLNGGKVGGSMHAFDSTKADNSITVATNARCVLPFYINKIENNIAEFVFDFWPFRMTASGDENNVIDPPSSIPVNKLLTTMNAFSIRVNTKSNTFEPIRMNDIKVSNDGNGVPEKGVMIIDLGTPTMLIFYK